MTDIPTYGENIGIFIKSEGFPFDTRNKDRVTTIEKGVTTLPVGTLIKLTQGEVKRVISPFKVLVTGFSGDVMNIVFGVSTGRGDHTFDGTVTF